MAVQSIVIFFFLLFLFSVVTSIDLIENGVLKLELIHRRGNAQRLPQLFRRDAIRLAAIAQKSRVPIRYGPDCIRNAHNVSGEIPMHSGAESGAGQYFVHFRAGSPAQKLVLIADTGSDLTWMYCKYRVRSHSSSRSRRKKGRDLQKRRVFLADNSSSFRTLPCSSTLCKVDLSNLFSLSRCPSPMDPCTYDYRYSDGSTSEGVFANETVTFHLTDGRKVKLHNVLVGCSQSSRGQSFQGADGVMGLAYSNYSFAVKTAARFGGKFSYCLVDHLSPKNVSSYLIFGSHEQLAIRSTRKRYTELVLGLLSSFYGVNLRGISIGASMLDIPAETWNASGVGGVIIDSGSSLTSLVQPAYQPVMAALQRSLVNLGKLDVDVGPFEYCFNSTGFHESMVPQLVFHFTDGARFEPHVKSYVIDAAPGVKCLGFVAGIWPGLSVIGNIMQQNHLWEFDLVNRRLGFAASSCTT